MKLFRFLFNYSPKFIILASLVGILGGLASTAVLTMINSYLRDPAAAGELWRFLVLCLGILGANLIARISIAGLSQWSAFDLRLQIGRKWIGTPLVELERNGSPRLLSAITQDVERLSDSMHALPGLCIDITVIVTCLAYLGYLSWWMLIVMVGFIAVAITTRLIPQRQCEKLLNQARRHGETMLGTFNAMAGGIKELKVNRARWNAFYAGELYETAVRHRDCNYRAELIYGLIRGYSEIIYFLFVGLLMYGSGVTGTLSAEVIIAFAVTLLYMKTNIDHVQDNISQITRAHVALSNLESLGVISPTSSLSLDKLRLRSSREEVARGMAADAGLAATAPAALEHGIRFEHVEYEYEREDGERGFVLGPVDLKINAGELLFVIGGNGSGKTTFAKILCGLYTPVSGEIILDGERITDDNRSWYAQHFGTVFSDSYLFDKLYGSDGLPRTDAVVTEYLKEFRLQDKVEVTGGKFSTISLSQGQRKRLALVTAYVEDRPVYMFDEWAADQDPEFRQFFYYRILPNLKARGKTVIVISHDDRYYGVADRVVKFEGGKLVAAAPHKALATA